MRLPVNHSLPLIALIMVSACSLGGSGSRPVAVLPAPSNGPAADYPMVIGEPFMVGPVNYRPEDKLNYDAVGRAAVGSVGGDAITLAHKTLPVPSYVELTSLDSGRTILARVDRRGPMDNEHLVELSPGAAAQLGVAGNNPPLRVRRVNPPEPERSLLRAGQRAPERMETPKALVTVLLRKLDGGAAPVPVVVSEAPSPAVPVAKPAVVKPVASPAGQAKSPVAAAAKPAPDRRPAPVPVITTPNPLPKPVPPKSAAAAAPKAAGTPQPVATPAQPVHPTPAASPAPANRPVSLVVQAGAYSSKARADVSAAALGGKVEPVGKLFRVRTGPYSSRAEADAALAKARASGYKDARIQNGR